MVFPQRSRRGRRRAGFTLLEAMIVVAIIGIVTAIAAPALTEAMADRRAGEVSHALVRIGARARSESMAYGRAHLLVHNAGTTSNGNVELWRGRLNLCSQNPWANIVSGACATSVNCLEGLDMATYDHGTNQVRLRLPPAGAAVLCFQPDGELLVSTGLAGPYTANAPAGTEGVLFTIERLQGGAPVGVVRRVVFPFGGNPSILR